MTPYIKPPKRCKCEFCDRHWSQQGSWWDDCTNAFQQRTALDLKRKGLRLLSFGRHRIVFAHKGFVLKVPRSSIGVLANKKELRMYRKYGKYRHPDISSYARCRMWRDNILVMERVACARLETVPGWAQCIDSSQVGYDIKGRLVAYDFG